jgi:DNA-binding MarR family transcriptional regulator
MLQPNWTNPEDKSDFLRFLQRRILLFLAINEPKNKYAIARAMKEYATSTRKSLKSLEESGLIKKIDKRMSLGRLRDCYWLTDSGVFLALIEGAKPRKVLERTREMYPENKLLHLMIEITPILGTAMHKIGYSSLSTKGKLDETDKSAMMSSQLQKELSLEQIKELFTIMEKYPEQVGDIQAKIEEMLEKMKKVESFLRETNQIYQNTSLVNRERKRF